METLPEEMVLKVIQHLSVQELAACCAVSRAWREVFNRDVFWRQRCDAVLVEHLRDTESVVEPGFQTPEVEGSGLSPVCEGRLSCMRQLHLHNNWRWGRCKTFSLPYEVESMTFYKDNLLVTYYFNKETCINVVQLWDVKSDPIPLSEYLTAYCSKVEVYKELIVLEYIGLVQVLTVLNLKFSFRHSFFVSEAKRLDDLSSLENVNDERFTLCETVTVGLTEVTISGGPNITRKLTVWNLKTGEKLKEEKNKNLSCLYGKNHCNDSKVAIGLQHAKFFRKIVVYDVGRLSFTDFSVTLSSQCNDVAIHKEYIATSTSSHINMYNLATRQLVQSIPHREGHCNIDIFHDNFIFCDAGNLKLINVRSLEEQQLVEGLVDYYDVVCQSILLCQRSKQYFLTSQHCTSLLPMKLQSLPRLFDFPYKIHSINNINTKVASHTTISPINPIQRYNVLHFW